MIYIRLQTGNSLEVWADQKRSTLDMEMKSKSRLLLPHRRREATLTLMAPAAEALRKLFDMILHPSDMKWKNRISELSSWIWHALSPGFQPGLQDPTAAFAH